MEVTKTMRTQTAHDTTYAQEDEMIRRTINGDREAFTGLFLKYKDSLFDLAARILGSRAEAEDVLQDAFIQAYRHLPDFNHESRFSTWLYSIVLNRVRNNLRHRKVVRWSSLDMKVNDDDDYRAPEFPERGPSFTHEIENRMELEALQNEARLLPTSYRSIFMLHYFQNLTLEEVSVRLGRPIGTIKVYLHRARRLLYKRLKPALLKQAQGTMPQLEEAVAAH